MPPSTRVLLVLLVVPLALLALRAGAPPTFYDALVYHLGLPMQMMARGEAFASPHDMFSALPLLAEMAASGALLLPLVGSPEAFAAVFAVWALLLLTCFADVARGVLGRDDVGVAAALALGASPVVGFLPLAQKSDLLAALFVALALRGVLLLTTGAQPAAGALVVFVALGLAGATKTLALPLGVCFVLGLALHPASRRGLRQVPPATLLVAVCAGLACAAPPLVRNVIAFGNPLYPFATSILGGRGVDVADLEHATTLLDTIAIRMRTPGDFVDLILRYAIHGDGAAQEVVGPLALIALPALLLLRPLPRPLGVALLLALLAVPVWLLTNALARYAPVLWLTTALAQTLVIARAMEVKPARLLALSGVGLSTLSLALWSLAADDILLRRPGALPREEMLRAALEPYGAYRAATALAGNGACVFVVGAEPRRAYAEVPLVPSEAYMVPALVTVARAALDGPGVRAAWRAQGVTHVIVDRAFANVLDRRGWALSPGDLEKVHQALNTLPPPIFDDGRYALHALGEVPAGACGR